MQMNCLERNSANIMSFPQSAQVLRKWCTPETILVIANLFDEDALLFHIVRQARQGATKIILIQAAQRHSCPSAPRSRNSQSERASLSFRFAQLVLARMARKLRWVGLDCEPILNKAFFLSEIHSLVRLEAVDRIIISAQVEQGGQELAWRIFTDHLVQSSEIPVCVIGTNAISHFSAEQHSGRVSVALSLNSDSGLALAFASRFAQERHLRLTVVHVYGHEEASREIPDRSPAEVASHLPAPTLREAELFCPLEICVRQGDPASELLKYDAETMQDFIILRSLGSARSPEVDESIAHRIIREAHCPVIFLGQSAASAREQDSVLAKMKAPASASSTTFNHDSQNSDCA